MFRVPVDDDGMIDLDDLPPAKKPNPWLALSHFFELISQLFHAFYGFFDALSCYAAASGVWKQQQDEFQMAASRDIETITSGGFDATTGSTGTG